MNRGTNRVTAKSLATSLATALATALATSAVRATATVALVWMWSQPVPVLAQDVTGEWRAYAGDQHSTKYSALDQINADNVADLQVAWSWDAAAVDAATGEPPRGFRATPLKIGDRLYVSTALNQVVALDAGTGEVEWVYDPKAYEFEACLLYTSPSPRDS